MYSNDLPTSLCLKKLFQSDTYYKIPVYQRNYDWGKTQIQQLIVDINDFAKKDDVKKEESKGFYYVGSLVVHEKQGIYEILDGQQRFTTLTLIACYLKFRLPELFDWYEKTNLDFESRPISRSSLESFYQALSTPKESSGSASNDFLAAINALNIETLSPSMLNGIKVIDSVITDIFTDTKNDEAFKNFAEYLLKQVKILRVSVPANTDVSHYFEVMNNRGEQLEKHEIVKANLLSAVQNNVHDMATIQTIWLACSDMSRYAQTRFSVAERKKIFEDNYEGFKFNNFNNLRDAIYPKVANDNSAPKNSIGSSSESTSKESRITFSLEASLKLGQKVTVNNGNESNDDDDGREERFTSVIDFPNFLMQVLRLYVKNNSTDELPPLDDKALIGSFKMHIGDDAKKAKLFVFTLLKYRYLFDRFIVKREKTGGKGEDWSLKHYKFGKNGSSYVNTFSRLDDSEADNDSCLMLLSAFHVSYPTNSSKNWLSAVLYWLDQQDKPVSSEAYLGFLKDLAKAFMVNRYLTAEPQDYPHFIYTIDKVNSEVGVKSETEILASVNYAKGFLRYGQVRLFVFNYLDYLLWKDRGSSTDSIAAYKSGFRFSMNNSVEHFSPQTPKANEKLGPAALHSFGNLCLLTSSDNSSLSNDGPEQKAKILNARRKIMAPLSLKLELMLKQADAWSKSAEESAITIQEHETQMFRVLADNLNLSIDAEL
ncbi:DUF262 domain-containing protein [Marinomonas algicola]|uniref:DUF262 domain-containing protein n=1 Tax=Marinomonas algicola TaxID=2773454 RepID=UPI00174DB26C|nr:DUF262 domain-containing protein [Marinomonas algicola]